MSIEGLTPAANKKYVIMLLSADRKATALYNLLMLKGLKAVDRVILEKELLDLDESEGDFSNTKRSKVLEYYFNCKKKTDTFVPSVIREIEEGIRLSNEAWALLHRLERIYKV